MSLGTGIGTSVTPLYPVRLEYKCPTHRKNVLSIPVGLRMQRPAFGLWMQHPAFGLWMQRPPVVLRMQLPPVGRRGITHSSQIKHSSILCAAALSATCAAEQTQTVTRESSTITVAPVQGQQKSPELDDGGSGFPPRDDDGGGGGGGGGGGHWSGGFFFFGFLAVLGFLKDQESERPYEGRRRR